MDFSAEILWVFAIGAALAGVVVMSVKARHKTLTRRNQIRGQRKFREQNAALGRRWN